ncbi:MAG: aspartate carbamoyltransferase [Dehalococcoidia bacterium]|nr:aspartate carbamoyltransferase [Dehalococcoidia bacterium]
MVKLANRHLVSIDDLSNGEIEALFSLADEMSDSMGRQSDLCRGKIMASLFFEPSTRTKLSFEAGMLRLGGSVISAADIGASSLAKGESIADMAKVVGSYADIIVIRHPWEGAARVVAQYAGIPVINAGDGSHEHPTQTLCDLYTIRKKRQTIRGLRIALWGDLKRGRTVHSLIYALARFGATILLCPGPGLELPEHVLSRLSTDYRGELKRCRDLNQALETGPFAVDAIYRTPSSPHQLAMLPDISMRVELNAGVDALYVTRIQKERQTHTTKEKDLNRAYPVVDKKLLRGKGFKKTLVMHPLPRVDELACEVDADPRSMYFKQAAYGVPVRMALIALMLGAREISVSGDNDHFTTKPVYHVYERDPGIKCPNTDCVSNQETEIRYIKPKFKIVSRMPLTLRCIYCDHELHPQYVASSEWHQGKVANKKYHSANSRFARSIRPENLIVFASEGEAQAQQFKPSSNVRQ